MQSLVHTIRVRGRLVDVSRPQVMGILNATPDSFYDQSRVMDEEAIRQRVRTIRREGATMLDIGGCSTRPGAECVSAVDEWQRLRPALEIARDEWPDAVISVATFRAEVARRAVEVGAELLKDISGGQLDPDMFQTVADLQVPYVLTDMQGAPDSGDVMADVFRSLGERVEILHEMGVADVVVDPGFGFGKTLAQNYEMMGRLKEFALLGSPLLVGVSRKSMIYRLLGCTPEQALNGTTVLHTLALAGGANILRVHDVRQAVEAITIFDRCSTLD